MVRAQETAAVVLECLEGVNFKNIKDCNLLEEGAPIPPEPPVGHWKPEAYVRSLFFFFKLNILMFLQMHF